MQEGTIVTGVVTKLAPFGAFVDIGGVRGLVHISQIKDGYIAAIEEELCVGEEVTAQVLSVEPQTGRVTLSMMALEEGTGAAEPLSQAQTGGHADSSSAGKHSRHKEEPLPVQVGKSAVDCLGIWVC
jgi:ribosomal protein S1